MAQEILKMSRLSHHLSVVGYNLEDRGLFYCLFHSVRSTAALLVEFPAGCVYHGLCIHSILMTIYHMGNIHVHVHVHVLFSYWECDQVFHNK